MHKSIISKNLTRLRRQGSFTDIVLNVSGIKIKAHKIVLASGSEYFERLLLGPFAAPVADEIIIDADPVEFDIVLNVIYGGEFVYTDDVSSRNITLVLSYFQVHGFNRDSIIEKVAISTDPHEVKDTFDYLALVYPEKDVSFFVDKLALRMSEAVRKTFYLMYMLPKEYIIGFLTSTWFAMTFTSIDMYYIAIAKMINHGQHPTLLNVLNYKLLTPFIQRKIPVEYQASMTGPIPNLSHNVSNSTGRDIRLMAINNLYVVDGDGNEWKYSIGVFNSQSKQEGDIFSALLKRIDLIPMVRMMGQKDYPHLYLR
jgi:hypothetical protein